MNGFDRIRSGLPAMPEAHRRVADLVIRRPRDAATMTIGMLAGAAGVSAATCNRFARALGYGSYADFRNGLIQSISRHHGPEDKLRRFGGTDQDGHLAAKALALGAADLRRTAATLAPAAFDQAVAALGAAPRLFVIGFGNAFFPASYAAYLLLPLLPDVREVGLQGGAQGAVRRLSAVKPGDAVLVFTLPRFSAETLRLAKSAREAGAFIVAVTGEPDAPIVAVADITLSIAAGHELYASSAVAAVCLAEALASAVAAARPGAIEALARVARWAAPYMIDGPDDAGPCSGTKA